MTCLGKLFFNPLLFPNSLFVRLSENIKKRVILRNL